MSRPPGRPPKPTKLKVLAGNPGKRALPEEPEVMLPAGVPEPPALLAASGREYWTRYWQAAHGWLALSDYGLMESICMLRDRLAQIRTTIAEEQLLHRNRKTKRSATHFLFNIELGLVKTIADLESRAALTPVDRARVKVEKADTDPADEFLRGRRGA